MTDYRHLHHPGLNEHRNEHPHLRHDNSSSLGGILIALAMIALIVLGLSMFFSPPAAKQAAPLVTDQTRTIQPAPGNNQ